MRSRTRDNPTLVFVTLVLVSFVLMTFDVQSTSEDDILSQFRSGAASLFGPVQAATDAVVDPLAGLVDGVVSLATLREANESLSIEVDELRAELAETDRLTAEVDLLRSMLNLSEATGIEVSTLPAEVQGTADDGSLTVDKGRNDGVLAGYPVLDESGMLIGRVVAVSDATATVQLLIDSTDIIEVTTPLGMRGAISGLGSAGELRYDVYEEAVPIAPETLLSTVGTNGYPSGLQVAMVPGAIEPIGDQITDARVDPVADFSRLPRFVAVVQYQPNTAPLDDEEVATTDDSVPADGGEGADDGSEGTTP